MPRPAPDHETTGWPPGVPFIIGNEGCERFSFYGMRSILYVYIAALFAEADVARHEDLATGVFHEFVAAVYLLPMIGAIVSDRLLGKYRTILWLSIVYCLGHLVLSLTEGSITGLYWGLGLIAVGAGGIKPCVSAHVGDQFGRKNWFRLRTVFQAFYWIINFGSFFATMLIPITKEILGTAIAFAIPGVLMAMATVVFWMGRNRFVHVPARPGGRLGLLDTASSVLLFASFGHLFFTADWPVWAVAATSAGCLTGGFALFVLRQRIAPDDGFLAVFLWTIWRALSGGRGDAEPTYRDAAEAPGPDHPLTKSGFWGPAVRRFGLDAAQGPVAVLKIISVFFLVSVFWALFDQHSSSWIRQAGTMDRHIFGIELLPSQIGAMNPLMVMILIPLLNVTLYPLCEKLGFPLTPLRRMTGGMALAALSFAAVAILQARIDAAGEGEVSIAGQILPYVLITVAEVMVSITGLEFAYSQAPRRMKSTIMSFWLLTVTLGNVLVALLARFGDLDLESFFWVFAALMAGAALLFGVRAFFYKLQDYPQE